MSCLITDFFITTFLVQFWFLLRASSCSVISIFVSERVLSSSPFAETKHRTMDGAPTRPAMAIGLQGWNQSDNALPLLPGQTLLTRPNWRSKAVFACPKPYPKVRLRWTNVLPSACVVWNLLLLLMACFLKGWNANRDHEGKNFVQQSNSCLAVRFLTLTLGKISCEPMREPFHCKKCRWTSNMCNKFSFCQTPVSSAAFSYALKLR